MNFNALRAALVLPLFFQTQVALADLPAEVAQFIGKEGRFVSLYNGEETRESGGTCKITLHEYDDSTLAIQAATYFNITADLEGAERSVAANNVIVYKLTDHGRRVGGSACGDYAPMTGYVKTLELTNDTILVRKKFRCGFFEKNDIMEVCDLRQAQ